MRDYEVKSNVEIRFNVVMYTNAEDMFSAEARVEKVIRDIILNNVFLKNICNSNKNINIIIESCASDLE